MPDISKFQTLNGDLYNLKDAQHRADKSNPHEVTKAQVGLENVANERQYSAQNKPSPSDIGAASQSDLTSHVQNTSNPHSVTAAQAGALDNSSVATVETGTASKNYAVGGLILIGSTLYKATASITQGDTLTVGTNITAGTIEELLAAKQNMLTFDSIPTQGSTNPVTSGGVYNAIQAGGSGGGGGSTIQLGTISFSAVWSGASSPYTQVVTVNGADVTASSKVDLQLTAAQIAALSTSGVLSLLIENNAGTLTAWAVGAAPSAAMTVQCTVEEIT